MRLQLRTVSISLLILVFAGSAFGAVLLNEDGSTANEPAHTISAPQNEFSDSSSLRENRRFGIGVLAGGAIGLAGLDAEVNFSSDVSLGVAFGGGPNYQSFAVQLKQVFDQGYLQPYVSGGYSRWYSEQPNGPVASTNPSFLANRFMDPGSRNSGDFAVNLLYPSAGLQYVQLSGPYTGSSIFVEVTGLLDLYHFTVVPTAGIGALYYF